MSNEEPRAAVLDILNGMFRCMFLFSLYCITRPLAYMADLTSDKRDVKFLED